MNESKIDRAARRPACVAAKRDRPAEPRRVQTSGSPAPPCRRGTVTAEVNLCWIPLGAGGHSVRYNGRVFEWVTAHLARRPVCDLYHAALQVWVGEARYVIEQAPVPRGDPGLRGVVAGGPVGSRGAGRLRLFRYEIRRWRDGVIPDIAEAVDSPRLLTTDPAVAQRVLDLVAAVPTPVWGRDELGAGEMWNSNSIMAWVITRAGLDAEAIHPPARGRAPGWEAGVTIAYRQLAYAPPPAVEAIDGNRDARVSGPAPSAPSRWEHARIGRARRRP